MTTPNSLRSEERVATILPKLGKAQRRVIMSLTDEWGPAACHQTAKRMFYGVAGQHFPVVFHKHRTDNCWCLSSLGLALKEAIAAGTQSAETGETSAPSEGCQSGGDSSIARKDAA